MSAERATTLPPKVVVLDDWEGALTEGPAWSALKGRIALEVHRESVHGEALARLLADTQALVLNRDRTPIGAELLARMPRLELVAHTAPRNFRLDHDALAARGIPVANTPGGPGHESTCEQAWALILAARRRLLQQVLGLRAGRWREPGVAALPSLLDGKRLGLIGLGHIGSRMARVGAAFGMEVAAWSPHLTADRAAAAGARAVALEELLSASDIVSLHLVAGPGTIGLVDARLLSLMKPDALLVNTSRASLVVQEDLVRALRAGRPGFAAIDVFETEPLPADDPLRSLHNVLLTPHMGFIAREVLDAFSAGVAGTLERWLSERTST